MSRRLPGRCYFCGDPCVDEWFCAAHLWAGHLRGASKKGIETITREHAYWIEKLTPEQIVQVGAWLEESAA